MSDKHVVTVERVFDHPIERVFRRYTDHEGWSDWAGFNKVRLTREGSPDRDGVGAVRAFALAPGLREEVTLFEPPNRMEYRVVRAPLPMSDHLGEVTFEPQGEGTRLVWRVSFRTATPAIGWVMTRSLRLVFERMLTGLARDLAR